VAPTFKLCSVQHNNDCSLASRLFRDRVTLNTLQKLGVGTQWALELLSGCVLLSKRSA
jgi:hypothetical protein